MKNFIVTLDITYSGDLEIKAENEKDVEKIVKDMRFSTLSSLSGFHFLGKDVYEIREVK